MTEIEAWNIVKDRYSEKNEYTKKFIVMSLIKFGDIYDYDKTVRIDTNKTKVIITCRIHGDFLIDPSYFISNDKYSSDGCPLCSTRNKRNNLRAAFEFEDNLSNIFPHFKLCEGEKYINNSTYINLRCLIHGTTFLSRPSNLLSGKCACPECNKENRSLTRRTLEEDRFKNIISTQGLQITEHGEYINNKTSIELKCNNCNGEFSIIPSTLLHSLKYSDKIICPFCYRKRKDYERLQNIKTLGSTEWNNKFDYSNSYLEGSIIHNIKCNDCGDVFSQHRDGHLNKHKIGCSCSIASLGEYFIEKYLRIHEYSYTRHYKTSEIIGRHEESGVEIDFSINYSNITYWIEYDGEQHYKYTPYFQKTPENFLFQLQRDINVFNFCKNSNIVFIKIPYTYKTFEDISNILDRVLVNKDEPFTVIEYPNIKYPDNYKGERIQYGK